MAKRTSVIMPCQLSTKTSELFARPLGPVGMSASADPSALNRSPSQRRAAWKSDWKTFSTKWRDHWDLIDARCRFTELAETNLGAAYDVLAQVHESLPAMRLKYNRLVADFDKEQADELRQIRQMLDDSRDTFKRQIDPGSAEKQSARTDEVSP